MGSWKNALETWKLGLEETTINIKKRLDKLEDYAELMQSKNSKIIILKSCCGPEPTEEEIEAVKKKFLKEHPDHRGAIMLTFKYDGPHFHHGEEIDYRAFKQLEA